MPLVGSLPLSSLWPHLDLSAHTLSDSQETKQLHHVEKQAKSQTKAEAKALKAQEKAQKALTKATAKVSAYLTLDAPTA